MHVDVATSQRDPVGHALSEVQFAGHVVFVPSHAKGAHDGAPTDRAGRRVHVPAGAEHVSHAPLHARSQQMPSAQIPVKQSVC